MPKKKTKSPKRIKSHKTAISVKKTWLVFGVILLLLVLVALNSKNIVSPSFLILPKPTATSTPKPEIGLNTLSEDEYVQRAINDLENAQNITADKIKVIKVEKTTWNDGSLGCPKKDRFYTQALVNGFTITLEYNNTDFIYHAGNGISIPCTNR